MKHFLSSLLLFLTCLTASAEELTYTYEGQTLTYTIDQEALTCEVKSGGEVSGVLIIPEVIKNGRYTYTVSPLAFPHSLLVAA